MTALKGGLVGFGFIAERGHAPAYREKESALRIVAIAEPVEARRRAATRAMPGVRMYSSASEMMSRESLDFIDVCTPPNHHMSVSCEALERGLHVICEKPLAMNVEEARVMASLANRRGRVLYPGHSYRHAPVIRAVRNVLARAEIGRVRMVTLETFRTTHAKGVSEWRPDWRRERQHAGGGILMDHGPHTFYLAFEWLGAYPTEVSAWTRTLGGGEVEDDVTCSLVFPTGVARAHLTWNAGFRKVIYTLHGDRGAVRVEDDELEVVVRSPDGKNKVEKSALPSDWMDAGHGPWFEGVLDGFIEAVRSGDHVSRETEDSVRAMETISLVQLSARQGGTPILTSASHSPRAA